MTTKVMCLWEVSHYGCLWEVSHSMHNWQRFTHVTSFIKYMCMVGIYNVMCCVKGSIPSCNFSFFINELQYFSCVDVSPLGFYHMKWWCYECCCSLCDYLMCLWIITLQDGSIYVAEESIFWFLTISNKKTLISWRV